MATMVRKQIYIERRQEALLKRLAQRRQVTEAEIIREALDRQLAQAAVAPPPPDPAAWQKALDFMKNLKPRPGQRPLKFRREDAYQDRLRRWR